MFKVFYISCFKQTKPSLLLFNEIRYIVVLLNNYLTLVKNPIERRMTLCLFNMDTSDSFFYQADKKDSI